MTVLLVCGLMILVSLFWRPQLTPPEVMPP
jgi:hypothetical protein